MTTIPCPTCGSTQNSTGATSCIVCKSPLPAGSNASLASAVLTTTGGRKYILSSATASMIGSRGCAILLSGAGVEPQHAKLVPSGSGFTIEPMKGVVFVNGKEISGAVPLDQGMDINIGSLVLVYSGPSAPAPGGASTLPTLIAAPLPASVASLPITPPSSTTISLRGGSRAPRWLTKNPPTVHGVVRHVDYKSSMHSSSDTGTTTDHMYWMRVEEPSGALTQVLLEGLTDANITIGDNVGFWGQWQNGMLYIRNGDHCFNYSTNSIVRSGFDIGWVDDLIEGVQTLLKKVF